MKLAEALAARADAQRRLAQLTQRIQLAARHQEGEAPPEDPVALLEEARRVLDELERLIRTINATNGRAEFEPSVTLTDALAKRDVLAKRRELLVEAANAASLRHDRYMRSEIRFVTPLDVPALRREADDVAREYRELDARIQARNWDTEVEE